MISIVDTVSNNFHLVDENLSAFGFSTNNKKHVYKVLSAILNLGNIRFEPSNNDEGISIEIKSRSFLCNAATLLKIDESELEDVLTNHIREVGQAQIK